MASAPSPTASPAKPSKQVRHIANPRRLLILSPTSQSVSVIPPLLHSLTGVPVLDPPQKQTSSSSAADSPTPPQSSIDATAPNTTTSTTFAGYTTHSPLKIQSKYYTAEIPVWVDEIPLATETPGTVHTDTTPPTAEQWRTEFLSAEAEVVREAVGALVVCVRSPRDIPSEPQPDINGNADPAEREDVRALRDLMRGVGAVKERIDEERGGIGDVPGVFVLVGSRQKGLKAAQAADPSDELGLRDDEDELGDGGDDDAPFSVGWWEDQLFDMGLLGWEVIEWDPREQNLEPTKNRFGEYEGMPRIKEVLETHDWTSSVDTLDPDGEVDLDFDDDEFGPTVGFDNEVHELEREMFGLRMAIERGGGDGDEDELDQEDEHGEIKVESMEALMMRMRAIREMSSDLSEHERKRFAAKAVQDIMREL
ncbi:uncharacterized protein PFLUO_LOCUS6677 [Penicillium psychrofluorescens]|uniref:uncharacterized protein n=1 Tax=Penicillium psychrofluorescens TaxID=3158075 RepID=UPI003CCE0A2F